MFISILYMFRAAMCPSSGELLVSIQYLVYVTLYRWPFGGQVWMSLIQTCALNGHLYRVIHTRCRIDTSNSPDDGHMTARNMYRIEINIHEKELCVRLVIYKESTATLWYADPPIRGVILLYTKNNLETRIAFTFYDPLVGSAPDQTKLKLIS
jgi:hypothetical protein